MLSAQKSTLRSRRGCYAATIIQEMGPDDLMRFNRHDGKSEAELSFAVFTDMLCCFDMHSVGATCRHLVK